MKAINIILDESDSQNPIFVEIENDMGLSIEIGERKQFDGFTAIRITTADIDLAVPDYDRK